LNNEKIVKQYFSKYLTEDDKEFKSLVKILNNKDNIQKKEKLKSKL